jgi:predicted nucleic acid-binding protein
LLSYAGTAEVYLLDKNVLDEIDADEPHISVAAWYNGVDETDLFISVLAVMEGRKGIEIIRGRKPLVAEEIERNLLGIVYSFQDRILPIDIDVAQEWGRMLATRGGNVVDAAIAATAKRRGFAVVTRNVRHFSIRGVRVINPYKSPPEDVPQT